ncbi:unnamed protein product [Symbiodinium sp. KB8]|nr:unnamed protein product [Symbiodinium sp. KB8]
MHPPGRGRDPELLNDLWYFELEAGWTLIDSGSGPPAREEHASAVDTWSRFWIFGGYGGTSSGRLRDLWFFDPEERKWTLASSSSSGPSARSEHTLMDDALGHLWVFGGNDGSKRLDDLWYWDLQASDWVQVQAVTDGGPDAREAFASGMSPFGGWVFGGSRDDHGYWNDLYYLGVKTRSRTLTSTVSTITTSRPKLQVVEKSPVEIGPDASVRQQEAAEAAQMEDERQQDAVATVLQELDLEKLEEVGGFTVDEGSVTVAAISPRANVSSFRFRAASSGQDFMPAVEIPLSLVAGVSTEPLMLAVNVMNQGGADKLQMADKQPRSTRPLVLSMCPNSIQGEELYKRFLLPGMQQLAELYSRLALPGAMSSTPSTVEITSAVGTLQAALAAAAAAPPVKKAPARPPADPAPAKAVSPAPSTVTQPAPEPMQHLDAPAGGQSAMFGKSPPPATWREVGFQTREHAEMAANMNYVSALAFYAAMGRGELQVGPQPRPPPPRQTAQAASSSSDQAGPLAGYLAEAEAKALEDRRMRDLQERIAGELRQDEADRDAVSGSGRYPNANRETGEAAASLVTSGDWAMQVPSIIFFAILALLLAGKEGRNFCQDSAGVVFIYEQWAWKQLLLLNPIHWRLFLDRDNLLLPRLSRTIEKVQAAHLSITKESMVTVIGLAQTGSPHESHAGDTSSPGEFHKSAKVADEVRRGRDLVKLHNQAVDKFMAPGWKGFLIRWAMLSAAFHPWCLLISFCFDISHAARALLRAGHLLTSAALSVLFYRVTDAVKKECVEELSMTDPRHWVRKLVLGIVCAILSSGLMLAMLLMRRSATRCGESRLGLRLALLLVIVFWLVLVLYIFLCVYAVLAFLANMSDKDTSDWVESCSSDGILGIGDGLGVRNPELRRASFPVPTDLIRGPSTLQEKKRSKKNNILNPEPFKP